MSQLLWSTLGIVCPTCDEHNAPRAPKCVSCGAVLLGPAPQGKASAASAAGTAASATSARAAPTATGAAPGGTNPKIVMPAAGGPRPATSSAPAPGGTNPRIQMPAPSGGNPKAPVPAPGGTNPRIQMPTAASRPPGTTVPAATKTGGAVVAKPAEPVKPGARPASEPIPPGMRPTSRATPAALIPIDVELPAAPAVAPVPPAVAPVVAPGVKSASRFSLVVVSGANEGQRVRVTAQGCQVGRSRGILLFQDDPFVSPLHASFVIRDGKLYVRDGGSTSGVLVTVHQELIPPGTLFAAGNHLFRYGGALEPAAPPQGRPVVYGAPLPHALYLVEEILVGGRSGRAVVTHGSLLTIGQTHCDLTFAGDESLASRHCELSPSSAGATLRDLSGGLGTFVHLAGRERPLNPGNRVRIGQQILQVEMT